MRNHLDKKLKDTFCIVFLYGFLFKNSQLFYSLYIIL